MPEIVLQNVDFSYGKKTVLEDLSFSLKNEGFTALLGANGAGKSTVFNLLCGILVPDSGTIIINGVAADNRHHRHAAKMGFVFQENTLDFDLSVWQNIRYFAGLAGLKNYQSRAEALLTEFGLWEQRSEKAAALNGGHRRRLEIVRALLPDPEILILDEPTSGLDPAIRHDISQRVHLLANKGVNVIWITHLLDEVEPQDKVILLEKGCIREQGTFAELGGLQGIKSKYTDPTEHAQL